MGLRDVSGVGGVFCPRLQQTVQLCWATATELRERGGDGGWVGRWSGLEAWVDLAAAWQLLEPFLPA